MVVPRRPLIVDVFRRHVGRIRDALAWRVAFAYEPMIHEHARRYLGRGLDFDELLQEGLIGMHRAAQLYDPTKGPLATHLGYHAKAAMIDAIVREGRLIRIPKWADQAARRVEHGTCDLGSSGTAKRRECILAAIALRARRIDGDAAAIGPIGPSIDRDLWRDVLTALDRLDDRARAVILARYFGAMTLAEAGQMLGVSRSRARQIEMRALSKLRAMLKDVA